MTSDTDRLCDIEDVSSDAIVSLLRDRFFASQFYTYISNSVLLSVNPYGTPGNLNDDESIRQYTADYRQTDRHRRIALAPHVFGLTCSAYFHMMRTGQDQSITLNGETSSGKSELRRLIVRALLALSVSPHGKKGARLALQIPSAEFVLEQFGNCQTLDNANASRFTNYSEMQFDENGKAIGLKILSYFLEKERIAKGSAGERNFHILYALVAGASAEEKEHLLLGDSATFRILASHARQSKDMLQTDAARFLRVKHAFKQVGLSKRQVASICQVLSAVLHLSNIDFHHERHSTQDTAMVRNEDVLDIVASFLGISSKSLQESLTLKTKLIRNEVCTILLDSDGAGTNRDDLISLLYSCLFSWLNEFINVKLCKDHFSTFVSILDCHGPQDQARQNSLDQFVVNYANEAVHRFMQRSIFECRLEEMKHEDLADSLENVTYTSNAECIRLIVNQPGGLVHIMDDQARRTPKKTDQTMIEAFGKRWTNHTHFKLGPMDRSGAKTFTINHFNGPITYSSHHLLDKNSNVVNPDFVSLLRGQQTSATAASMYGSSVSAPTVGGSSNAFIRGLFDTRAVNVQAHPRHEQTLVAAQQSTKPARAPSMRRPNRSGTLRRAGTMKKDNQAGKEDDSDEEADAKSDGGGAAVNEKSTKKDGMRCVAGEIRSSLQTLIDTLEETKAWFIICIRPNDHQLPNQFEARLVKEQASAYAVKEMTAALRCEYSVSMTHEEFCERYADLPFLSAASMKGSTGGEARQKCLSAKEVMNWAVKDAAIGRYKMFLSHTVFRQLEDELRAADADEARLNERRAIMDADAQARGEMDPYSPFTLLESTANLAQDPFSDRAQSTAMIDRSPRYDEYGDDAKSYFTDVSGQHSGPFGNSSPSYAGTESYAPSGNMFSGAGYSENREGFTSAEETTEVHRYSSVRRKWMGITWMMTFCVPSPLLKLFGLKRSEVRMAWREKLAINIMIWLVCASAVFVITLLGNLICPKQHVFSEAEFQAKINKFSMTRIRGEVFNLDNIVTMHRTSVPVVQADVILKYAGIDASVIFPVQVNALCNGISGSVSPWVQLSSDNTSDVNTKYHDFRAIHPEDVRPDWYYESMVLMRSNFHVGFMGYTPGGIADLIDDGRSVGIYHGEVFDVSNYIQQGYHGAIQAPAGQRASPDTDAAFMVQQIISLFNQNPGQDLTKKIDSLPLSEEELQRQRVCLRNLFFIGKQDDRNSPQCQFSRYILLSLSIVMVAIIGFKFLAALQFGRQRRPEDHDKFVICQVPCYTEGEESMRKTINSLAALKYDDKRKLLFIICDGMIVGSGNDRPTPRIVLDIMGADTTLEPEPLSFLSLGEGSKQHNMAKVYSGLYEYHGHVVPYVVVAKCGKPTEHHRPGNRGKRDSQLILMRFLNKVHFGLPMNPMELEVFHQIKNIIGVNPSFYEYVLQVDADTEVEALSLNRFVSAFTNDKKVIGLCGETSISNSKRTFITMLQVYEYFISHYLSKAFESLFGSVTCLPGCFSMFRIRTPDTHRPLFIAHNVVDEYAENRVDTLHTKNLLHLGEDRYLTTLVLKHFGDYKTMFVSDAKAMTTVPEEWSVLLSQRRRWINSTIHNLFELLSTPGLCGFCLFSMRFVVFIDLLSTIVAPVTLIYIVYLLVLVIKDHATVPLTAILMLSAIYGLQAILFLLRRRFDMVVWMLIYIIGLPIWTFFLPLYSFWHMDDFSWGNTRVVMGEKGKKIVTHDEGTFDPSEIPLKTWQQYEEELWERNSARSIGSILMDARRTKDEGSTGMKLQRNRADGKGFDSRSGYAGSVYTASYYGHPGMESHAMRHSPSGTARQSPEPTRAFGYQSPVFSTPDMGNYQERGLLHDLNAVGGESKYGGGSSEYPQTRRFSEQAGRTVDYFTTANYDPPLSSHNHGPQSVLDRPRFSTTASAMLAMGQQSSSGRSTPLGALASMPLDSFGGDHTLVPIDASSSSRPGSALMNRDASTSMYDDGQGGASSPMPSDDDLAREVRAIVASSDLHTITLKDIRAQLEAKFGPGAVAVKRGFINDTIDDILGEV